jgi:hypothetical protein
VGAQVVGQVVAQEGRASRYGEHRVGAKIPGPGDDTDPDQGCPRWHKGDDAVDKSESTHNEECRRAGQI